MNSSHAGLETRTMTGMPFIDEEEDMFSTPTAPMYSQQLPPTRSKWHWLRTPEFLARRKNAKRGSLPSPIKSQPVRGTTKSIKPLSPIKAPPLIFGAATSVQARSPLCALPIEILDMIAQHLTFDTQLSLFLSCKSLLACFGGLCNLFFSEERIDEARKALDVISATYPALVPCWRPGLFNDHCQMPPGVVKALPYVEGNRGIYFRCLTHYEVLLIVGLHRLSALSGVVDEISYQTVQGIPITDERGHRVLTNVDLCMRSEMLLLRVSLEIQIPRATASGEGLVSPLQKQCVGAVYCWHYTYKDELILEPLLSEAEILCTNKDFGYRPQTVQSALYRCRMCPTEIEYTITGKPGNQESYFLVATSWRNLGSGRHQDNNRRSDSDNPWSSLQSTWLTYIPAPEHAFSLKSMFDGSLGEVPVKHIDLHTMQTPWPQDKRQETSKLANS